jgi:hypothetical protein
VARHRCHLSWSRCPRLMVDPVRTPTVARVRLSNPDVAARKAMWDRCWPCRPTPGSVVCKPSILHLSLEGYVGLWVFGRRCPARRYKPSVEGSQQVGMRSRLLDFFSQAVPHSCRAVAPSLEPAHSESPSGGQVGSFLLFKSVSRLGCTRFGSPGILGVPTCSWPCLPA